MMSGVDRLSSRMMSAPAAARRPPAQALRLDLDRHRRGFAAASAPPRCTTPPASRTWLSLISMPSSRPKRWLTPPPARTAYFSSARSSGVVLRVSRTVMRPAGRVDELPRQRGDAGQPLQEVERRALGGQQRRRAARESRRPRCPARTASPSPRCTRDRDVRDRAAGTPRRRRRARRSRSATWPGAPPRACCSRIDGRRRS